MLTPEEAQMYQAIANVLWWIAVIGAGFVVVAVIALFPLIWSDLRAIFKRT